MWASKFQTKISLSRAESEYDLLSTGLHEVILFTRSMQEIEKKLNMAYHVRHHKSIAAHLRII